MASLLAKGRAALDRATETKAERIGREGDIAAYSLVKIAAVVTGIALAILIAAHPTIGCAVGGSLALVGCYDVFMLSHNEQAILKSATAPTEGRSYYKRLTHYTLFPQAAFYIASACGTLRGG